MSAIARVNSSPLVIAQQHVITELIIERDKAREKYATAATEYMLASNKLCNERDEAREATMRIDVLNFKLRKQLDVAREKIKSKTEVALIEATILGAAK